MNVNDGSNLNSDTWEAVFKHAGAPFSFLFVCKSFHSIFSKLAFDVYQNHPSLKEKAWYIEQKWGKSSSLEKIKKLRDGLDQDKDLISCGKIRNFKELYVELGPPFQKSKVKQTDSVERFAQLANLNEHANLINLLVQIKGLNFTKNLLKDIKAQNILSSGQKIRTWLQVHELDATELTLVKGFIRFSKDIGLLTHLTALSLVENLTNYLTATIGQLTGLKTLSLQGNDLDGLSAEIKQLTRLEELYIEYEEYLTNLPAEIGQLTSLKKLRIRQEHLSLPTEIRQLTGLKELYIRKGQLKSLPTEIVQILTSLKQLEIKYW